MKRKQKENSNLSSHIAKAVVLAFVLFGVWLAYNGLGIDYSGFWIGEAKNTEGARVVVAYRIERRGIPSEYYVTNDTYQLSSMSEHKPAIGAIIKDRWMLLHCMVDAHGEVAEDILTVAYSILPLTMVMDPNNPNEIQCASTLFHTAVRLHKGTTEELEQIKAGISNERKELLQKEYAGLTYSVSEFVSE